MTRRSWMILALAPVVNAWYQNAKKRTVNEIAAELRQSPNDISLIAELGKTEGKEASLALVSAFELATDKKAKQEIASSLLVRGSQDPKYWEYLAGFAREAVESTMPWPLAYDKNGKSIRDVYSTEFLVWCKANRAIPEEVRSRFVEDYEDYIFFLKKYQDPRSKPILMKGLSSPNYFLVRASAHVLAFQLDREAVPLIISACARAPQEAASVIAPSLLYFEDPELDSVAKKYINDPAQFERRREEFKSARKVAAQQGVKK